MVTLEQVRNNPDIACLIDSANRTLAAIGYTEHGRRHMGYVSHTASAILSQLHYDERIVELAAIAGWIHDVGNCVNRHNHGLTGALLVFPILRDMGMPMEEVTAIISAIGNHEEQSGKVVSEISAALVLADKSDAHRTRVRHGGAYNINDIHDRVNYAIQRNDLTVDATQRTIIFSLEMEETSSVMDFLQIYLSRMLMSEQAAHFLHCRYNLIINGQTVNNHGLADFHVAADD